MVKGVSGQWIIWVAMTTFAAHALGQALEPSPAPERIGLIEAVRLTLSRDPNIRIEEEHAEFAQGAVQRESGAFDLTFDTALSRGVLRVPRTELERLQISGRTNLSENASDLTNQRMGLTKQFRSGPSISTGVEINRLDDSLDQAAVNRANVNFVLNIPLLKGFGASSKGAAERAARMGHEAALLDLTHVTTQRVLNTTTAYWNCLGAEQELYILRASAARADDLLSKVRQLVDAGELPAAELKQTGADVSEKRAAVNSAEQRFVQARHTFALAIGAEGEELSKTPLPVERWPQIDTNRIDLASYADQQTLDKSLMRRADYQAARKNGRAAEILETAARRDLKPQMDLTLEAGYAGLSEGSQFRRFYSSADPRAVDGPNAMATLRFVYPFGNQTAKGLLTQRKALRKQAGFKEQDLARNIRSSILVAFSELAQTREELVKARLAADLFDEAVRNEGEKLRIGTSTILDVINTADRLASAKTRATAALVRYGIVLARVRFETGLLLPAGTGARAGFNLEDFLTMPGEAQLQAAQFGEAGSNPSTLASQAGESTRAGGSF